MPDPYTAGTAATAPAHLTRATPRWRFSLADVLVAVWLLGVLTALVVFFHTRAYDDPYITYRYAQNIAQGNGFVYNIGEQTLSTTTPLYALLLAGIAWLGIDVPLASNLIACVSLAAGGGVLWLFGRLWRTPMIGAAGALLYPTTVLLTNTVGSEMPLLLLLVLLGLFACATRRYSAMVLALALATLTRYDAVVAVAVAALAVLVQEGTLPAVWHTRSLTPLRRLPWHAAAIYLAVLLPWLGFAAWYFGDPLPSTLAAKQQQARLPGTRDFPWAVYRTFMQYSWNSWAWFTAALCLPGALLLLRYRPWLLLVGWSLLYGIAYTLLQVPGYFWYVAPLVVGVVVLIGGAVQGAADALVRLKASPLLVSVAGGVLLLVLVWQVQYPMLAWAQANPDQRYPSYRAVGEWFTANTPPDTQIALLETGIIGYYAMPRTIIDYPGLLRPAVAAQLQPEQRYAGAALWVMHQYQPDYMVFHQQSDALVAADPQFAAHCTLAQMISKEPYTPLVIYRCAW